MSTSPRHLSWWLREPLVHFVFLGLLVFAVWAGTDSGPPDARTIVLDDARRSELVDEFRRTRGREPTPEEVAELVDAWIVQEILFREGLALGLDQADPVVRNQVVGRMTMFYRSLAEVATPDEAELSAYLARNIDRYATPPRWDFVHVFLADRPGRGKSELEVLLRELRAGADPHQLGDRFDSGRRFRQRTRAAVTELFDADFAEALASHGEGPLPSEWFGVRSRHGWHALRVLRQHPGQTARFEEIRAELEEHYRRDQELSYARDAIKELRGEYHVREGSP